MRGQIGQFEKEDHRRALEETIRTCKTVIAAIEGKTNRKMPRNVVALNA